MLDLVQLRKDPETVVARLRSRGVEFDLAAFRALEERRRTVQTRTEQLQARRNALSKAIGRTRAAGEDASAAMAESVALNEELQGVAHENEDVRVQLTQWLLQWPNLPEESVPVGMDESANVELRRWSPDGSEPPVLPFEPRDHVDLGAALGLDFETAAKLSGARFVVMKGPMARLHRALTQLMLDTQTNEHGYTECAVPYIVNEATMRGTGQLPKFEADLFAARKGGQQGEGDPLYLIPTSEVPLTNFVRDEIVPAASLPIRLTAHTPCFRSEKTMPKPSGHSASAEISRRSRAQCRIRLFGS